ncbi:MAG: hypothetical protein M3R24_32210 [Chloroflexota bacterium]|nr:hypothetical protein [Chloroflexota bacterium]
MLTRAIAEALQEMGLSVTSSRQIDTVIRLAEGYCNQSFLMQPRFINFQNGTLDLETMQQVPHHHTHRLTYCLPYEYRPGVHARIDAFLTATLPDPVARNAYKAHVGLAIMSDTRLHQLCLLIGPKRSGKTTLLRLANLVCGQQAASFAGPSLFDRRIEGKRSREGWNRQRIVCVDELPAEALQSEELIKIMGAHSGAEMRGIRRDEQTDNQWRPKLLFATNEPPFYKDLSGALTARLLVLPTPNEVPQAARDLNLLEDLEAELGAFAATCIDQALTVLREGRYPDSPLMRRALEKIAMSGNYIRDFIDEMCVLGATEKESYITLYPAYRSYCAIYGHRPLDTRQLASALEAMHIGIERASLKHNGQSVRGLKGLRLRKPSDSIPEDAVAVDAVDERLTPEPQLRQPELAELYQHKESWLTELAENH